MRRLDTARLTDTIRGQLEDDGLTWLRLDAGLGIVRRFDSPAPFRRLKARSLGGCLFLAPSVGNLCLLALLRRFGVRCKPAQRSRPRSAVASASSARPQCGPASGLVPRMIRRQISAIAGVQHHAATLTRARSTAQEVLPRRMTSGSIAAPHLSGGGVGKATDSAHVQFEHAVRDVIGMVDPHRALPDKRPAKSHVLAVFDVIDFHANAAS